MARHRRADSDSTVATVDENRIRWHKETTVLRRAPLLDHSDDWPVFTLRDAIIYHEDGETLANVLELDLRGPLVARGRLDIEEEDQKARLVRSTLRSANIEIRDIKQYCIGDEPYPVVWVGGQAGWYEVFPHPRYAAMHRYMCQGIGLYYGIMGAYEDLARRPSSKGNRGALTSMNMGNIFFKSAVWLGNGIVEDEVTARCNEHAQFLLAQLAKDSVINWQVTGFCRWMRAKHPEIHAKLQAQGAKILAEANDRLVPPPANEAKAALEGSPSGLGQKKPSPKPSKQQADSVDTAMPDVSSGKSQAKSRTKPPSKIRPDDPPARLGLDMLMEIIEEIHMECPRLDKVKPNTVHSRLFQKCRIKSYQAPPQITRYYATELLRRLSDEWSISPFYDHLLEMSALPNMAPDVIGILEIPAQLARRARAQKPPAKPDATIIDISEGSSRQNAIDIEPPPAGRVAGKHAVLRLSSGSKKRNRDALDGDASDGDGGDDSDSRRARKTSRTSHFFNEGGEEELAQAAQESEQDDDGEPVADEDERDSEAEPGDELVRYAVHSYRVPSTNPTGSNDAWCCREDGCTYIVRNADEPAGQDLIWEHLSSHGEQPANKRIELAVSEASRGNIPISHLLEKLRRAGMSADSDEHTYIGGQAAPKPVKKKFLTL